MPTKMQEEEQVAVKGIARGPKAANGPKFVIVVASSDGIADGC